MKAVPKLATLPKNLPTKKSPSCPAMVSPTETPIEKMSAPTSVKMPQRQMQKTWP
jgi:hypothetical protein